MHAVTTRHRKAGLSGLFLLCALLAVMLAPIAASAQPIIIEVASAELAFDQRTGEPVVTVKMTEASRKVFADYTSKNVGRPIAIRIDGKVLMKPVIREPVLGGSVQLVGGLTAAEAKVLAEQLSKGQATIEFEVE